MANATGDLKERLAAKAAEGSGQQTAATTPAAGDTVSRLLERMRPQIEKALPRHMDADRMLRMALTVIRLNPEIATCTQQSLLAAIMISAQLGLEPGPLGYCYLIPFNNYKAKAKEVQFIVGYKGYLDLARRSGKLQSVSVQAVRKGDEFYFERGLHEKLIHRPELDVDPDPTLITHFYGVFQFLPAGHHWDVKSRKQIDAHRLEHAGSPEKGPWATHFEQMGKKTIVRTNTPYLPLSAEMAQAAAADEQVYSDPEQAREILSLDANAAQQRAGDQMEQEEGANILG